MLAGVSCRGRQPRLQPGAAGPRDCGAEGAGRHAGGMVRGPAGWVGGWRHACMGAALLARWVCGSMQASAVRERRRACGSVGPSVGGSAGGGVGGRVTGSLWGGGGEVSKRGGGGLHGGAASCAFLCGAECQLHGLQGSPCCFPACTYELQCPTMQCCVVRLGSRFPALLHSCSTHTARRRHLSRTAPVPPAPPRATPATPPSRPPPTAWPRPRPPSRPSWARWRGT